MQSTCNRLAIVGVIRKSPVVTTAKSVCAVVRICTPDRADRIQVAGLALHVVSIKSALTARMRQRHQRRRCRSSSPLCLLRTRFLQTHAICVHTKCIRTWQLVARVRHVRQAAAQWGGTGCERITSGGVVVVYWKCTELNSIAKRFMLAHGNRTSLRHRRRSGRGTRECTRVPRFEN